MNEQEIREAINRLIELNHPEKRDLFFMLEGWIATDGRPTDFIAVINCIREAYGEKPMSELIPA